MKAKDELHGGCGEGGSGCEGGSQRRPTIVEPSHLNGSSPIATKLERTTIPGIFRRHAKGCGGGRCSCAYVVVWRHRGTQYTETYRTLAEAREAKGHREVGDRRPTSRVGFTEYFEEWIESYGGLRARGFSETTRPEYRRPIAQHAVARWGGWRLAEVEPADVRELFGDRRRAGASTAAIRKLRAALSAMFATAVEDGFLRSNPVQGVRVPPAAGDERAGDGRAKALTRAELELILTAFPDRWCLFFEFLTHTGLRIGEATGLTWEHVELGTRPRVRVREQVYRGERRRLKSGHGRRDIPLSDGMAHRLAEHRRDTYGGDGSPVFPSAAGTPMNPSSVSSRVLKPAARDAGLVVERDSRPVPWVSFHTFRHTCASLLFEGGKNVKQVQEWLGHADPGFTLRTYVHLLDDGLGGANFLDEAVRASARASAVG